MFLEKDLKQAEDEQNCFEYLLGQSTNCMKEGQFTSGIVHLENAIRSLNELNILKNRKTDKTIRFIVEQNESNRQQKELLHKMQVNIYE